jgi:hypothetical protein
MDGWMDGWMVLHVHPLVVAMVVVFLVSCFLPHGREETGGGSGELWLVFLGKSSLRERSVCLLQRFSYVVFCNPNRREEGGGRLLIVCKLNFTLANTLAYRLLFFPLTLEPPSLPPS